MIWTADAKQKATIEAPMGITLFRDDTQVIKRPGWYQLVTPSAPGSLNEVILSQLANHDVERVIDETIAQYRAVGQGTKWCVGPWTTPGDFGERLSARGFRSWDVWGMVSDTSIAVEAPRNITIHAIDLRNVEAWVHVSMQGWGIDSSYAPGEQRAAHRALVERPTEFALFAASIDGEWLGTAALIVRNNYGYFYATQVLEAARGRGIYRSLIQARLRYLADRDIRLAVTQARAATSAPVLAQLGFETVFKSRCYKQAFNT